MQNEYHMEQSIATKIWGPQLAQLGSFSSSMSKHNIGVAREVRRGVGVHTHTYIITHHHKLQYQNMGLDSCSISIDLPTTLPTVSEQRLRCDQESNHTCYPPTVTPSISTLPNQMQLPQLCRQSNSSKKRGGGR